MSVFSDRINLRMRSGFTLIEMLAAIAIIVTLIGISTPILSRATGDVVEVSLKKSVSLLTRARAEAIALGEPVGIVYIPANTSSEQHAGRAQKLMRFTKDSLSGDYKIADNNPGITRWEFLSDGVYFFPDPINETSLKTRSVINAGNSQNFTIELPLVSGQSSEEVSAPAIIFSPTGSVVHPSGNEQLSLSFLEGRLESGKVEANFEQSLIKERTENIVIRRATGRARHRK